MRFVPSWWQASLRFAKGLLGASARVGIKRVEFAELALAARSTSINRSSSEVSSASAPSPSARVIARLDGLVAFFVLERNLIVRNIHIHSEKGKLLPYGDTIKSLFIINAHIWVFWLLGRQGGSFTSYVTYFAAGFTIWPLFSAASRAAVPHSITANFTKNVNIKWVNLFIADLIWHCVLIVAAGGITLLFYTFFPFPMLGPPITHPKILLLLYAISVAATLGAGYGLILRTAILRWPVLHAVSEVLRWSLFITSGVYHSYANLPWYVARYVWFQPMVAPIEYSRNALDPGYPVADLSLVYSTAFALALLYLGLGFRKWERKTSSE
jgi:ABC-type polysaccharide/polyol phosphate export permease